MSAVLPVDQVDALRDAAESGFYDPMVALADSHEELRRQRDELVQRAVDHWGLYQQDSDGSWRWVRSGEFGDIQADVVSDALRVLLSDQEGQ